MGCLTGFVAKIFLTAFNAAVALTGVAVLTLCALVFKELKDYGGAEDLLSAEANSILTGLESISGFVICLGVLGMLVACCCQNKLFLYTYFVLGLCMVVVVLTFGIMGTNNFTAYGQDVKNNMTVKYVDSYNFTNPSDPHNTELNKIFAEKECCGAGGPGDYKKYNNLYVPTGCCKDEEVTKCEYRPISGVDPDVYNEGCFDQLNDDVGEMALATFNLGIFFGVLLLALVMSTCVCLKCTDAMPI